MQAFWIEELDGEFRQRDTPRPTPKTSQALIRVKASGVNPLDTKIQQGFMHDFFPVAFP